MTVFSFNAFVRHAAWLSAAVVMTALLTVACSEKKVGKEAYEEVKDETLADIKRRGKESAREIGMGYAAGQDIPVNDQESFYLCLGDYIGTKNPTLKLQEVMGWCSNEYNADREAFLAEQAKYDYFAVIEQFSGWDGSHRKTEAYLKESMNDPDSYEHVEARYVVMKDATPPHMIILTKFRGKNAFGGVVTNIAKVKVDLKTGDLIEIMEVSGG